MAYSAWFCVCGRVGSGALNGSPKGGPLVVALAMGSLCTTTDLRDSNSVVTGGIDRCQSQRWNRLGLPTLEIATEEDGTPHDYVVDYGGKLACRRGVRAEIGYSIYRLQAQNWICRRRKDSRFAPPGRRHVFFVARYTSGYAAVVPVAAGRSPPYSRHHSLQHY